MKFRKLNELATFNQGLQVPFTKQNSFKIGPRFIRIVDFTSNWKEEPRFIVDKKGVFNVLEDDIIMIRYGSKTAGKVFRGVSGVIANNLFKIEPLSDLIDKDFLFHYLNSPKIYSFLNSSQSSSTMPAITFSMIGNVDVPIFSLEKQKLLAKLFNSFESKIKRNNSENKNLKDLKYLILEKELHDFSDFFVEKEYKTNA